MNRSASLAALPREQIAYPATARERFAERIKREARHRAFYAAEQDAPRDPSATVFSATSRL